MAFLSVKGERAFFYHSNVGKEIVGIVEVIRERHHDPTLSRAQPWVVVDFKAVEPVPKPVTLEAVKAEPKLKDMALMKYSRLSVQPVTDDEWKLICKMGGMSKSGRPCMMAQEPGGRTMMANINYLSILIAARGGVAVRRGLLHRAEQALDRGARQDHGAVQGRAWPASPGLAEVRAVRARVRRRR